MIVRQKWGLIIENRTREDRKLKLGRVIRNKGRINSSK